MAKSLIRNACYPHKKDNKEPCLVCNRSLDIEKNPSGVGPSCRNKTKLGTTVEAEERAKKKLFVLANIPKPLNNVMSMEMLEQMKKPLIRKGCGDFWNKQASEISSIMIENFKKELGLNNSVLDNF